MSPRSSSSPLLGSQLASPWLEASRAVLLQFTFLGLPILTRSFAAGLLSLLGHFVVITPTESSPLPANNFSHFWETSRYCCNSFCKVSNSCFSAFWSHFNSFWLVLFSRSRFVIRSGRITSYNFFIWMGSQCWHQAFILWPDQVILIRRRNWSGRYFWYNSTCNCNLQWCMKFRFLRGSVNHAQISCPQLFLLGTCPKNSPMILPLGHLGRSQICTPKAETP